MSQIKMEILISAVTSHLSELTEVWEEVTSHSSKMLKALKVFPERGKGVSNFQISFLNREIGIFNCSRYLATVLLATS